MNRSRSGRREPPKETRIPLHFLSIVQQPAFLAALFLLCVALLGLSLGNVIADRLSPTTEAASNAQDRRDFSLTDMSGNRVSLASYQGKWLLVYFGFTHCPEACPLALSNIDSTLKALGPVAARNVQPLFVTLDPERDPPNLLKTYLANFDGNVIGLTGTTAETAAIAKAYGVFYKKVPTEDGGYTLDHSAAFYLITPQGIFLRTYAPNADPDDLAKELLATMHAPPGRKQ